MTAINQNNYFDVFDDIVDKYNNTIHKTIKMKPIEVTVDSYVEYDEHLDKKDPKFIMLVTILEFQNIKIFLLKDILQSGQKKFLLLVELKIQILGLILLMI